MDVLTQVLAGQQSVRRVTDGDQVEIRGLRDGSLVELDWRKALCLEGRVFKANFGGLAVPGGVACKAALTLAQPDINIDVPQGIAIIPMIVEVAFVAMAGTANNFLLGSSDNLIGNGTSVAGPTPLNVRSDKPFASRVVCRQAYSANGAVPTNQMEIHRFLQSAAAAAGVQMFDRKVFELPELLIGPASLQGYGASTTTAMTVVVTVWFAEFRLSEMF